MHDYQIKEQSTPSLPEEKWKEKQDEIKKRETRESKTDSEGKRGWEQETSPSTTREGEGGYISSQINKDHKAH